MNLVSMALQYLTPVLVGKLASSLGINSTIANTIVRAAVPVILGAILGKTAKPQGARDLFDVLAKQDTGLLGRLSSVLGGPQQKTIADQGSNVLGSMLGTSSLGSLVDAVSKYANVNTAATSGIVGMLAPIVLGTLSQQQKSANLDAGGVVKLLGDQKANIAAAIPADLTRLLAGSGLLDAVTPKTTDVTATQAPPAKPFNGWPWAALVAAASLLWGSWFGGDPAPWAAVPAPPRLMAGSTDVSGEFDTALKSLHGLMSTIKDKASAEAAAPQLRLAQTRIDQLDNAAKQLPADSKRILAGYLASWLPVMTPIMTSLLANTSAGPVVKPMLDAMRTKLEALARG